MRPVQVREGCHFFVIEIMDELRKSLVSVAIFEDEQYYILGSVVQSCQNSTPRRSVYLSFCKNRSPNEDKLRAGYEPKSAKLNAVQKKDEPWSIGVGNVRNGNAWN